VSWSESPLTPALSPLSKGGEGAGVGGFKISRLSHQVNSIDVPLSPPPHAEPLDAVIILHNCLTPTEVEVLQRVADKGSVREAAQAICRSETTLKRELAAIRAKLGVRTTLQVVVWALRQGVIR
jgi:DNA-binding NarL/FixJ family response regulator